MIRINGQHLIRRILEGERYFAGMILENNFNLIASPDFPELQKISVKTKVVFFNTQTDSHSLSKPLVPVHALSQLYQSAGVGLIFSPFPNLDPNPRLF